MGLDRTPWPQVFLRTVNDSSNATVVARFSVGEFADFSSVATFMGFFNALSVTDRLALLGSGSGGVFVSIRSPRNETGFGFSPASSLSSLRLLGVQNVTRLVARSCPAGQRPSFVRELSNLTVRAALFGPPTTIVGCEDIDECNLGIDVKNPLGQLFDKVYPLAERHQDVVERLNRTDLWTWNASSVCERRPPTSLPTDFGHFRSPVQPHVCVRRSAGPPAADPADSDGPPPPPTTSYVCQCADGFRAGPHPNDIWSFADRSPLQGASSCVEMSCLEHKCLSRGRGAHAGWPGIYWSLELGATLEDRVAFLNQCFRTSGSGLQENATAACCSAGVLEVLHCLSSAGVCHDSML